MPKTPTPISAQTIGTLIIACTALLTIAGPLSPPAGPVASTFKTLAEVEPRIPISAATTPGSAGNLFRINQPGSYYLSGDVAVPSGVGIAVFAADVLIDLNGFTLRNSGSATTGVSAGSSSPGLRIRNGALRGFTQHGIQSGALATHVDGIRVTTLLPSADGIELSGKGGHLARCTATGPTPPGGGDGLAAVGDGSIIEHSSAVGFDVGIRGGRDALISRCRVAGCGTGVYGLTGARVRDSAAARNGREGFYLTGDAAVEGCAARENRTGFRIGSGSTLAGCTARFNDDFGYFLPEAASLVSSVAADTAGIGAYAANGSLVARCVLSANGSAGLHLVDDSTAEANLCDGNASGGILVNGVDNRVHGNTLTDNATGLDVYFSGNFIARNAAAGSTVANYTTLGVQTAGPIVAAAGSITTPSPHANFAY